MTLLKIYCNDEFKSKFTLQKPITRIGRAEDNDIVIDNPGVSLHHARIIRRGETYFIEDNDSTNGLFVNGERVESRQLQYGDEIAIHKHCLKFSALDLSPFPAVPLASQAAQAVSDSPTIEIDIGPVLAALKERQTEPAYLLHTNGKQIGQKFMLSKSRCNIGKGTDCDINVGGWLAPKLAAKITKQSGSYFVFPEKGERLRLNGISISEPARLQSGDSLEIRGVKLTYYDPAAKHHPLSEIKLTC